MTEQYEPGQAPAEPQYTPPHAAEQEAPAQDPVQMLREQQARAEAEQAERNRREADAQAATAGEQLSQRPADVTEVQPTPGASNESQPSQVEPDQGDAGADASRRAYPGQKDYDPSRPVPAEPFRADEPTTYPAVPSAVMDTDVPPSETGVITSDSVHPSVLVRLADVARYVENFLARHPELRGLESDIKSGLAAIERHAPAAPGSPASQAGDE
jgi:hypothetical protein